MRFWKKKEGEREKGGEVLEKRGKDSQRPDSIGLVLLQAVRKKEKKGSFGPGAPEILWPMPLPHSLEPVDRGGKRKKGGKKKKKMLGAGRGKKEGMGLLATF